MNCCGVNGAADFNHTVLWDHLYNATYIDVPPLCCKNETTIPLCGFPEPKYKTVCYLISSVFWFSFDKSFFFKISRESAYGKINMTYSLPTLLISKPFSKGSVHHCSYYLLFKNSFALSPRDLVENLF